MINFTKEYHIEQLMKISPSLKSQVFFFLFKDAIETVKFLQGRDQKFYAEYLQKF